MKIMLSDLGPPRSSQFLLENFETNCLQTKEDFHKGLVLGFSTRPLTSVKLKLHGESVLDQQN